MIPPKTATPFPSINNIFVILSFFFFFFSHGPVFAASAFKRLPVFSTDKTTDHPTTSILSLSLHPRSSIIKPPRNMKYSDLVLSRLARDHARRHLINSNIQRAISLNSNRSHVPIHQPKNLKLRAPLIPSLGVGEYVARIGMGQPVKEYLLEVDTGSNINWLECKPCKSCYKPPSPIFDPSKSTSYRRLSCESHQCALDPGNTCDRRSATCIFNITYGDGSFTSGDLATETLSFGRSGSVPKVVIGCARVMYKRHGGVDGLLGVGGTRMGFPSQIKATSFSYCLVDRDSDSSSTLEFNSAPPGDSVHVRLVNNPSVKDYYYVELTGIRINGELVRIPKSVYKIDRNGNGGIILDSGTTLTQLPTKVYNSLRDTFVRHAKNLPPSSDGDPNDTCYDLSNTKHGLPQMSFEFDFGGKTVPIPPENYFYRAVNQTFCLAFNPISDVPISIIGNNQQQRFRITYNLARKVFILEKAKELSRCPD